MDAESDCISILFIDAYSDDSILLNAQEKKSIDTPPTVAELIDERALDDCCKAAPLNVGRARSEFHIDQQGPYVRKSIVVDFIQIKAPTSLQTRILYLPSYPPIAGHPG